MDLQGLLQQYGSLGQPTDEDRQNALKMGLLSAGLAMLQNRGQGGVRPTLGQGFGEGGMAGVPAYAQALQQGPQMRQKSIQEAMQTATLGKNLQQMTNQEAFYKALGNVQNLPSPGGPQEAGSFMNVGAPQPSQTGGVQPRRNMYPANLLAQGAAAGVNIEPFLKLQESERARIGERDTGQTIQRFDKETGQILEEIPKTASPSKDEAGKLRDILIAAGVDPNGPQGRALFQAQAMKMATHQPATQVSMQPRIELNTGQSLAGKVGDIAEKSQGTALGAIQQFDLSQRVKTAIDSGQAIVGPGADARLVVAQIGQTLGIGGKDIEDQLVNTRNVIKGLAEASLAARAALKGQGQISDYEGKLLQKAASGDVSMLTVPEIRTLMDVTEKIARRGYDEHQRIIGTMKANPAYQSLVPFYDVPSLPGPTQGAPSTQGFSIVNPRGAR